LFLYCSECNLDELPELPDTLSRINCSSNNIKVIPEPLPNVLGEVAIYNNQIEYLPVPSKMTWTMQWQNNPVKDNPIRLGHIEDIVMRKQKENHEYFVKSGFNDLAFDEFAHYIDILHKIT